MCSWRKYLYFKPIIGFSFTFSYIQSEIIMIQILSTNFGIFFSDNWIFSWNLFEPAQLINSQYEYNHIAYDKFGNSNQKSRKNELKFYSINKMAMILTVDSLNLDHVVLSQILWWFYSYSTFKWRYFKIKISYHLKRSKIGSWHLKYIFCQSRSQNYDDS